MSPYFFFFLLTFVLKSFQKGADRVYFPDSKSAQGEQLKINSGNGLCSVSSFYIPCIFLWFPHDAVGGKETFGGIALFLLLSKCHGHGDISFLN